MGSERISTYIGWIYYFALGLMLVSLPFSNYFMSVSQFMLVGVFILDGLNRGFRSIFRDFFHRENAPAWVLSSLFLLHLAGLFFTTDFDYALKDLRIKLPILILPIVLSTAASIDRQAFRILIYLFVAAVLTGTFISLYYILGGTVDTRDTSIYISHIRFSLLIDMAIFISGYLMIKKSDIPRWIRIAMGAAGLWMVVFLYLAAYMTGLVILMFTAAFLVFFYGMNRRGLALKLSVITGMMAVFIISGLYVYRIGKEVNRIIPVDMAALPKTTKLGNPYWHQPDFTQYENGHHVWLYISMEELEEAWNRRSQYVFEGKDKAGQPVKYTLLRFLTSKGYTKDAEGVEKLTPAEVAMVEEGIASIVYVEKPKLYVRIYKIFWEYKRYQVTGNPSGHSVMQRLEFWRAATFLIRDHWLTGVGTGDIENEYQAQYDRMNSLLEKEYRWRAHNQFLTIFATFGIFGLAWFLFALSFPAARLGKFYDYYYLSFFVIIVLSMFTEDTLETQAGVTQFAFFTAFYLFPKKFIDIV